MKKKILLIIGMFLIITNVKALTFNVSLTDIEDKGSNSLGTITNIDVANKELDLLFEEVGDEVNFELTITNSGDRAGTLREIEFSTGNDKIEYTSNLPENGLAINGNDTNKVTINAKTKEGIVKGKTTRNITIRYKYDEGSCPEGEILTEDESMCLCPEGKVRNENGICIDPPEEKVECKDDEIYNETKKICEKKIVTPPSNPKTMDNIILISLLFVVSGLGIYAVMFKKLKTTKQRRNVGIITGVITITLTFGTLASVFGIDRLLGAIVNPVTKSKEIVIKVNEEYDPVDTWDGDCDITEALTPSNIFEGGTGTESDPYQIKTANQLACFAKSINQGTTYEGKYVKQIKNIKLNDNLNAQARARDLNNAHVWKSAGNTSASYNTSTYNTGESIEKSFNGTYDGDNYKISGLYLTDASNENKSVIGNENGIHYEYRGLFGVTANATIKNLVLSDVYIASERNVAALVGLGYGNTTISNVKTYGTANIGYGYAAGVVYNFNLNKTGEIEINNVENNINFTSGSGHSMAGVVSRIDGLTDTTDSEIYNVRFTNVINKGNFDSNGLAYSGGIVGSFGMSDGKGNALFNNVGNSGYLSSISTYNSHEAGLIGEVNINKLKLINSYNKGDIIFDSGTTSGPDMMGGLVGYSTSKEVLVDNCYNSGNLRHLLYEDNPNIINFGAGSDKVSGYGIGGLVGFQDKKINILNSFNSGNITLNSYYVGGLTGESCYGGQTGCTIENSYNIGDITNGAYMGGLVCHTSAKIKNSYNKGTLTQFGTNQFGGLSVNSGEVSNSYNEGDMYITTNREDGAGYAGGICRSCSVKNSYNRGNIITKNCAINISGISSDGPVTNSYNSGDITFLDSDRHEYILIGGISSNGAVTNSYNLGNITVNYKAVRSASVAGITNYATATNSVNAGDVIIKINTNLIPKSVYLSGISSSTAINCFNSGNVSILYSNSQPVSLDIINNIDNYTYVGEITTTSLSSTGNKFNTSPNKYAIGEVPTRYSVEDAESVGVYTTEETPDILSIINAGEGGNAFNDELDEDGLPTLKVFN